MKTTNLLFGLLLVFGATRAYADNAFTGQSSDASHAYYLRARYYDPETGIFLTKDPIGVSSGLNSYQYVKNSPVNGADPLGLFTWWDYTTQVGSYVGGTIVTIGGVTASAAGIASSEVGVGVPILAGGVYLTAQGGSSMISSGRNLWYIILNPNATQVPLNSSGLVGAAVSAYEGTSSYSDGYAGTANFFASTIDVLSTFNVGGYVQVLNNQAQVAKYLPGLAPGLVTDGQAAMIASSYGLQTKELAGFGAAWDGISAATTGIGAADNVYTPFRPAESSASQSPSTITTDPSSGDLLLSLPIGGVLLDKAAQLVGQNLSDITGAMYDPVSGQFVFLGTNNPAPVKNLNLDYLYTALQAVYGSAQPPFVTLNPSASAYTQWTDFGNGIFEPGEYGGFTVRYNPLWANVDTTVDVLVFASQSGTPCQWRAPSRIHLILIDRPHYANHEDANTNNTI